jgi:hypothetical protein
MTLPILTYPLALTSVQVHLPSESENSISFIPLCFLFASSGIALIHGQLARKGRMHICLDW